MDYTAVGIHDFYTFLLVLARVGGLMVAAPLLGNRAIPRTAKAGLGFVFSLAITPLVASHTGPIPSHLFLLVSAIATDALFGMALGYLARMLLMALEMAGYFIDTQMGFGFINLIDPFTEQHGSPLSVFQYQLALTFFLLSNGHLMLLGAVVDSFSALPPGTVSPQAAFGMTVVPTLKTTFILGLRVALPSVGVLLVMDVGFGLLARMVPQLNVFIVGLPAKIIVGLMTVVVLLPFVALTVGQIMAGMSAGLNTLIAGAK